ncbi:hypothetical protein EA660_05625 [Pseudoxanthomonas winnipegensis]|uniref:Uncharacterized protein n=1 Tax=Pseudoxanthomonas winnipegensis TaxID=2480810 RepID=A0A4Q8LEW8_9GAMM|nr:hypothetical protein E6P00_09830 [Pseudomonas aeruginosa]TAA27145.1 hypothetical protein EA660_05625 [Pseudoxanthomonas winnipegensis]RMJ78788.1 hypothetical protein IPC1269_03250 [Pseudomonas aeruginosa]RMX12189.1 hypothetical protein CKU30_16335 [Pseudomonas aeruginosa]RMX32096.1 hypothetical protein CKQ82_13865 [Pseudomonas aeruginosa]
MLSGVALSCYQACQSAANPRQHWVFSPSNIPNLNSLTFSRAAPFRWTTAERQKAPPSRRQEQPRNQPRSARQNPAGFPAWRAAP